MCILRYLPGDAAVARRTPRRCCGTGRAARRSNSELTRTTPCFRQRCQAFGARARDRLGAVELGHGLVLAEVGTVVQFLQQHQPCALRRGLAHALLDAREVGVGEPWSNSCTRATRKLRVRCHQTSPSGNCMVTQCRLPFCQIRDGTAPGRSRDRGRRGQHRYGRGIGRIAVGRHQHSAIEDQEVRVTCCQRRRCHRRLSVAPTAAGTGDRGGHSGCAAWRVSAAIASSAGRRNAESVAVVAGLEHDGIAARRSGRGYRYARRYRRLPDSRGRATAPGPGAASPAQAGRDVLARRSPGWRSCRQRHVVSKVPAPSVSIAPPSSAKSIVR
jgi:hypothetical protein